MASHASGRLIVVVDDDANIRKALAIILRKEHYQVSEASSVRELEVLLQTQKPELIFLDVMLTDEDGFAACQRLKTDPRTKDIPLFLLTARGLHQDVQKGFMSGADEYVLKPFMPKDIVALAAKYAPQGHPN
jgi:DNA-binding response OmpR family regulator